MKKHTKRAGALLLTLTLLVSSVILCLPTFAAASVELSTVGSLNDAINSVADGGTVNVSGTYTLPSGFVWQSHGKTVTVKGGTIDASALSTVTLGDGVRFENTKLIFKSGATLYANGHTLSIAENVTVTNSITVYGGGAAGSTVTSTDVTLMSGTYAKVYGGSNGGTVSKDTHLYIGGTVNSTIDETNHSGSNNFYGGGNADRIGGDTDLTVADSAKAHYIFGGSTGTGATIGGTARLNVTGGKMMSIYGASNNVDTGCDAHTVITGGSAEQVFGGNQAASLTGNVTLKVLGGNISRRIYGGCYNEVTRSGLSIKWSSQNCVKGDITLVIGSGANITLDYDGDDLAIYAKSRYKTKIDTGTCKAVFSDPAAKTKYNGKLGIADPTMQIAITFSGGRISAADSVHTLSHTASGAVLSEACDSCAHTAKATLALVPSVSTVYNGQAICPVGISYDSAWLGERCGEITYSNNVNAGTATASSVYARESLTLTLDFEISKASVAAPSLSAVAESVQGQADGYIVGLTTDMEYRVGNGEYTRVSDPDMRLTPGRYTVRIAEMQNHNASAETSVTVGEGRHVIDMQALKIKCQFPTGDGAQSEKTTMRLISTVDHLNYEKVGFCVWLENAQGVMVEQAPLETDTVYASLRGKSGESIVSYSPEEEFCEASAYFFTVKLSDVPNEYFNRTLKIRAYVVTHDGYTVYGETAECTIAELIA